MSKYNISLGRLINLNEFIYGSSIKKFKLKWTTGNNSITKIWKNNSSKSSLRVYFL